MGCLRLAELRWIRDCCASTQKEGQIRLLKCSLSAQGTNLLCLLLGLMMDHKVQHLL